MRVSARLSAAIAVAGLLIFGTYGLWVVRGERAELQRALRREVGLLGRSLQVALENALRDRQIQDVTETLDGMERIDSTVDIWLYDREGLPVAASRGAQSALGDLEVMRAALTATDPVWLLDPQGDPTRLLHGVPLRSDDGRVVGALVIAAPLATLLADLAGTEWGVIFTVLIFVLLTAVVGLAAGATYIGRPLARMVDTMRRIRAGDMESVIDEARTDEVGDVAIEFNTMMGELRGARRALETAAEERQRLERGLQRADRMIALGQLSAGLAHEIGSPLQVLLGRARMLLELPDASEVVRRQAEMLVAQTDRIDRIVQRLLAFARRGPARRAGIDLVGPVQQVVELLRHEASRRQVALRCDVPEGPLMAFADPDQVQQVAFNLLTNALSATPSGGQVAVAVSLGVLQSPTKSGRLAVLLEVSDTGSGIAAEAQEGLFEPFFTTRAAEGGTGLGLSVVKAIVLEHEGSVTWATSPAGTRFTVSFPAVPITDAEAGA